MYRCRHFTIEELVPPDLFQELGAEGCWRLLDENALRSLDALRDHFGVLTINDWNVPGGRFKESGLRDPATTTGAKRSQHKRGAAFDVKSKRHTPREMFNYIRSNPSKFPLITTLENVDATPTWLHFDTRNHGGQGILVVNP